jgi:hypothetical protein
MQTKNIKHKKDVVYLWRKAKNADAGHKSERTQLQFYNLRPNCPKSLKTDQADTDQAETPYSNSGSP